MIIKLLGSLAIFVAAPSFFGVSASSIEIPERLSQQRDLKNKQEETLPYPARPLVWGDVNFLHTTDVHGWVLGHQHETWPEPNYSGDLGDLYSFLQHMRSIADAQGRDLLLIDSGDHHDGPGLVTYSLESADLVDDYLSRLNYDVLAIGNHELYRYEVTRDVWEAAQNGRWNGRYLTTNVNITVNEKGPQPVGKQYAKFTTKQGRRVTAFGILYAFKANPDRVVVQPPAELIKEAWFKDAIEEKPDLFILAGHMAIRGSGSDFSLVQDAIREVHPDVPVFTFGGHTHIRDCVKYDDRSMALESGRFMETVGWMSANLSDSGDLQISRRYLDNNRRTYKYHVKERAELDTLPGMLISANLKEAQAKYNLSRIVGYAPQNYFLARVSFRHPDSVLTKLMYDVLPAVVNDADSDTPGRPRIYIANSGCQRFDVFKGPFTLDDQFIVSPFVNGFALFTVKGKVARDVAWKMNDNGASQLWPGQGHPDRMYDEWMQSQSETFDAMRTRHPSQASFRIKDHLTLGYVTKDACGSGGDDVVHEPCELILERPRFVSKLMPSGVRNSASGDYVDLPLPPDVDDDADVDVIIMQFFVNDFVRAVHDLDPSSTLKESDGKPYAKHVPKISDVWGLYAERFWN